MTQQEFARQASDLAERAASLAEAAEALQPVAAQVGHGGGEPFIVGALTVFLLALFVGYYVVWKVTPALHSPLMSVTNAISSVIIVGALIAVGSGDATGASQFFGFLAVTLAAVNIFGGFIVTNRMLSMFKKKQRS